MPLRKAELATILGMLIDVLSKYMARNAALRKSFWMVGYIAYCGCVTQRCNYHLHVARFHDQYTEFFKYLGDAVMSDISDYDRHMAYGRPLYFHPVSSFLLFSSPNLSGRRLDVCHTSTHGACGLSANLECRSEMCCKRLAENTGRNKVAKNRHLGTNSQLFRAISSQLRHISTIGKNVKQQYLLHAFS